MLMILCLGRDVVLLGNRHPVSQKRSKWRSSENLTFPTVSHILGKPDVTMEDL